MCTSTWNEEHPLLHLFRCFDSITQLPANLLKLEQLNHSEVKQDKFEEFGHIEHLLNCATDVLWAISSTLSAVGSLLQILSSGDQLVMQSTKEER